MFGCQGAEGALEGGGHGRGGVGEVMDERSRRRRQVLFCLRALVEHHSPTAARGITVSPTDWGSLGPVWLRRLTARLTAYSDATATMVDVSGTAPGTAPTGASSADARSIRRRHKAASALHTADTTMGPRRMMLPRQVAAHSQLYEFISFMNAA